MTTLRQYDAMWAVFGKFPLPITVQTNNPCKMGTKLLFGKAIPSQVTANHSLVTSHHLDSGYINHNIAYTLMITQLGQVIDHMSCEL